jgi:hypothetical protein
MLDAVTPAKLHPFVRCGVLMVGPRGNYRVGVGQFLVDGIGIVALVGQQSVGPVCDHADQRTEALNIVRLSGVRKTAMGDRGHRTGREA